MGPEPRVGSRKARGSARCSPAPALRPLPKSSRSSVLPLTQQFPEKKLGGWRGERQIPLVGNSPATQPGVGGCQIAIFNLGLPKVMMLSPPLPAMLPLNSALQHDVGFLYQFSGARTPTLGALLCRCVVHAERAVICNIYLHMKYKSRLFLTW